MRIKSIPSMTMEGIDALSFNEKLMVIRNPERLMSIKGIGPKTFLKVASAIKGSMFCAHPKARSFRSADLATKVFAQKNDIVAKDVYHKSERMKWYLPSFELTDCFGPELHEVVSQLNEKPIVSVKQANFLLQKLLRVGANEPFKVPENIEMLRMGPSEAQRCLKIKDGETVDELAKVNWVLNPKLRFGENVDDITAARFREQFVIASKAVTARAKACGIPYSNRLLKFYCFSSTDTKCGDAVFGETVVTKKLLALSCAGRDPRKIMKDMAEAKFFTWLSLVFTTSEPISNVIDGKIVIDGKSVKAVIVDDVKDIINIPEAERVTKEYGLTREKDADWEVTETDGMICLDSLTFATHAKAAGNGEQMRWGGSVKCFGVYTAIPEKWRDLGVNVVIFKKACKGWSAFEDENSAKLVGVSKSLYLGEKLMKGLAEVKANICSCRTASKPFGKKGYSGQFIANLLDAATNCDLFDLVKDEIDLLKKAASGDIESLLRVIKGDPIGIVIAAHPGLLRFAAVQQYVEELYENYRVKVAIGKVAMEGNTFRFAAKDPVFALTGKQIIPSSVEENGRTYYVVFDWKNRDKKYEVLYRYPCDLFQPIVVRNWAYDHDCINSMHNNILYLAAKTPLEKVLECDFDGDICGVSTQDVILHVIQKMHDMYDVVPKLWSSGEAPKGAYTNYSIVETAYAGVANNKVAYWANATRKLQDEPKALVIGGSHREMGQTSSSAQTGAIDSAKASGDAGFIKPEVADEVDDYVHNRPHCLAKAYADLWTAKVPTEDGGMIREFLKVYNDGKDHRYAKDFGAGATDRLCKLVLDATPEKIDWTFTSSLEPVNSMDLMLDATRAKRGLQLGLVEWKYARYKKMRENGQTCIFNELFAKGADFDPNRSKTEQRVEMLREHCGSLSAAYDLLVWQGFYGTPSNEQALYMKQSFLFMFAPVMAKVVKAKAGLINASSIEVYEKYLEENDADDMSDDMPF